MTILSIKDSRRKNLTKMRQFFIQCEPAQSQSRNNLIFCLRQIIIQYFALLCLLTLRPLNL
jgi:hypothetical protein